MKADAYENFIRFLYLERKYEEIVLKGGSSRCWKRWEELTAREMTGFWLKDNKIRKQIPWQIELAAYIKCPFLSSLCLLSRTFNFNIQYLKPYLEGNVSQISHYRNALMQVNFIYHELDSHIENLYNTCSSRIFYTRVQISMNNSIIIYRIIHSIILVAISIRIYPIVICLSFVKRRNAYLPWEYVKILLKRL